LRELAKIRIRLALISRNREMKTIMKHYEKLVENTAEIIPQDGLKEKLKKDNLIIKLGFDPTAPDLHLGHAVVLRKLRDFQDAGHTALVIIGGFTAKIGDPTGRDKTRPPLSEEQIAENARTYIDQLSCVLDMDKVIIKNNQDWLDKLGLTDVIDLLSEMTVAQMLQRNDFQARFAANQEIRLHEFAYPLLQGLDSVEIKADIEIGGTDQLFNTMVGRQLQQSRGEGGQILIAMPLLRGTDGKEKMSKSKGNYIALKEEPKDMYAKVMSIPDELMEEYIVLASSFSPEDERELIARIPEDPMGIKKVLAFNITETYHNTALAKAAERHFERNVQGKGKKDHQQILATDVGLTLGQETEVVSVCKKIMDIQGQDVSQSAIRRIIASGGVSIGDRKVTSPKETMVWNGEDLKIKIGKRGFYTLVKEGTGNLMDEAQLIP
jgi:tyrosyl-tRNA synthetase